MTDFLLDKFTTNDRVFLIKAVINAVVNFSVLKWQSRFFKYIAIEKNETKLTVERLYKLAEILEAGVGDLLEVNPNNVYHQYDNHNNATLIAHQEVQNLYEENKDQNQKIIELYEARLQDKDRLIARLELLLGQLLNLAHIICSNLLLRGFQVSYSSVKTEPKIKSSKN